MKKLRNSKKNVQRFAMEDSVNSAESHGIGKDTSTVEAGMTEWKGSPLGSVLEK